MSVRHSFGIAAANPVIVKVRSLDDLRVRARVGARRQPAPSRDCTSVAAA